MLRVPAVLREHDLQHLRRRELLAFVRLGLRGALAVSDELADDELSTALLAALQAAVRVSRRRS